MKIVSLHHLIKNLDFNLEKTIKPLNSMIWPHYDVEFCIYVKWHTTNVGGPHCCVFFFFYQLGS